MSNAYLLRMPVGIPGDIVAAEHATVESAQFDADYPASERRREIKMCKIAPGWTQLIECSAIGSISSHRSVERSEMRIRALFSGTAPAKSAPAYSTSSLRKRFRRHMFPQKRAKS